MHCSAVSSFTLQQNYRYHNIPNPIYEFNSHLELQQSHALVIKSGIPLSIFPLNRIASVCALSTPSFQYAARIFRSLDRPEMLIWNYCLRAFAESDSPFDAIMLFYQLRVHSDSFPDSHTFSFVLKACIRLLDAFHGRIVHGYVEKLGLLRSNLLLRNMILNLYASCGRPADANLMFFRMENRDIVTWNTMIVNLAKNVDIDSAYALFLRMPERNVRSWTSMIAGYVQSGKPKDAIDLYRSMEETGLKPNEATVVAVLSASADVGDLDLGIRIHDAVARNGFRRNLQICNSLIHMYVECGSLRDAYDVFSAMETRSVVSWSTMIRGLAIHGRGEESLRLFSEMGATKPNGITFLGVLTACSHRGMVEQGLALFRSMIEDHGIDPTVEHYGCIVDLLSRAGFLRAAYEFIERMPSSPNAAVWGALLGGCRLHKNPEIARIAAQRIIDDEDNDNDGYYVVAANTFSEAGQREDSAKARMAAKARGLIRNHGRSWITAKGRVHEFIAGDLHPGTAEKARELRSRGYVPKTGTVAMMDATEEERRERVLWGHSEKSALVLGLAETEAGETIRIFKNVRVCEDCHEWFKVVSEVEEREILLRDRKVFHCFRDGICSCGDYW
ncbi:hypothetical protein M569_03055 [Genlisea aurea]|uniref:DYW domain-containing protein n=1 Tax=Genlisea aurea TaxID=192259 RepID=S8CWB5_9LAMI|nr:hypothetical protein M569_03055 [Genlisea aurea]